MSGSSRGQSTQHGGALAFSPQLVGDVVGDGVEQPAGGDLQGIEIVAGKRRSEKEGQLGLGQQALGQFVSTDDPGVQFGLGHHVPLHRSGAEELHFAEDLAVTLNLAELEDAARVDGAIEGDPPCAHQIELLAQLPLPHDRFARQVATQKQGAGVERRGKAGFQFGEFGVKTTEGIGLLQHDVPVAPMTRAMRLARARAGYQPASCRMCRD